MSFGQVAVEQFMHKKYKFRTGWWVNKMFESSNLGHGLVFWKSSLLLETVYNCVLYEKSLYLFSYWKKNRPKKMRCLLDKFPDF